MQTSTARFFAPVRTRTGERNKTASLGRRSCAPETFGLLGAETGASSESVFKRFPAIGDTPSISRRAA